MHWLQIINAFVPTIALMLGGFIAHRFASPKDHEQAKHLAIVAGQLAAVLVIAQPNASWAQLVQQLVNQISDAAGLSAVAQADVLRAAQAALVAAGKRPEL